MIYGNSSGLEFNLMRGMKTSAPSNDPPRIRARIHSCPSPVIDNLVPLHNHSRGAKFRKRIMCAPIFSSSLEGGRLTGEKVFKTSTAKMLLEFSPSSVDSTVSTESYVRRAPRIMASTSLLISVTVSFLVAKIESERKAE